MLKINWVNYGLADRIGNELRLNKLLLKQKDLLKIIMDHEEKHLVNKDSLKVDLEENFNLDLFLFCVAHPSTWSHFSPLHYRKRTLIYSKTYALFWGFILLWGVLVFTLARLIIYG